ncbi:MFS transporter [Pseudonocardia acaciae]|uniref:MFS transporter n=1 Tax=Pseudonocardia acaciae TaxID=551276 RepID=UPI001FE12706|nr:MFS transporter [Pseudonocardia acaciae]
MRTLKFQPERQAMRHVGRVRWQVSGLIGVGIVVNYLDRTALSFAGTSVREEFGLTTGELGLVLSAFYWTYCASQLPVGLLLDRMGVRWITRACIAVWSLASFLTALASGFGLILAFRLLLGIGESPVFPAAAKATGYWFPRNERGLATAFFDGAARVSNVVAAPVLAAIVSLWGWRASFVVLGALSVVFGAAWWVLYRDPADHARLSRAERAYIMAGGAQEPGQATGGVLRGLGELLRMRKAWAIILGFACYEYAFSLLLNWLPSYLQLQYGVPLLRTGLWVTVPWVVAALASFVVGGWLLDRLVTSGRDPSRVRKGFLAGGLVLGLTIGLAGSAGSAELAVVYVSVSIAGLSVVGVVGWSLPALVAPHGRVGSLGGSMNFVATLVDIVSIVVAGYLAQATDSFLLPFAFAAGVLALGLLCYLPLLGRIEPAQQSSTARRQPV